MGRVAPEGSPLSAACPWGRTDGDSAGTTPKHPRATPKCPGGRDISPGHGKCSQAPSDPSRAGSEPKSSGLCVCARTFHTIFFLIFFFSASQQGREDLAASHILLRSPPTAPGPAAMHPVASPLARRAERGWWWGCRDRRCPPPTVAVPCLTLRPPGLAVLAPPCFLLTEIKIEIGPSRISKPPAWPGTGGRNIRLGFCCSPAEDG